MKRDLNFVYATSDSTKIIDVVVNIHFNISPSATLQSRFSGSLKAENIEIAFPTSEGSKMSQKLITKEIARQLPLFSLNVQNVDELFPGFSPGDFAVVYGSPSISSLTSMLCIRAQLPISLGGLNSNVVFVDGGNTFKLYSIAKLAQLQRLDPKMALNRIFISRAFTAYQMTSLIMEHLKGVVEKQDAKIVIISDIAGLFLDEEIDSEEAEHVFSQVVAYLQKFAREKQLIIIATCPSRQSNDRYSCLKEMSCGKANVVLGVKQTMYDCEFTLEKHPSLMLGSSEYSLEKRTLADYM